MAVVVVSVSGAVACFFKHVVVCSGCRAFMLNATTTTAATTTIVAPVGCSEKCGFVFY